MRNWIWRGMGPLWVAGASLAVVSCTDVQLAPAQYPAQALASYCTDDASTYDIPIRIIVIIDTSASMQVNDPEGHRAIASAELVSIFSGKPNVSFAFIEFNSAATQVTEAFTKDPAEISASLNELNKMEGFTNYIDALSNAQNLVNEDIAKVAEELAELEEQGESTRFARPWYFVIFLSDGIPRMPGGVLQKTESILFQIEQLVDVPRQAAGLTVHTAFLGAEDDAQRLEAELLLQQMAAKGGGSYTSYESGDEIDFTVFDFEIKRLFDIKQFFVYNRSSLLGVEGMEADSDQDGISDIEEEKLGTDPTSDDTDGDGCSDGFERAAGLNPLVSHCPCDDSELLDSDNDGLSDCEELYLGYNPARFDTDGDLFPDMVELRVGTNAADGDDWKEDLDFDGVLTAKEIRENTNPVRADAELHEKYAYRYEVQRQVSPDNTHVCYSFSVTNVSVVETLETSVQEARVNDIVFELIESPEDAAEQIFKLRRLVIPVNFRHGKNQVLHVQQDDFVTISEQDLGLVHE